MNTILLSIKPKYAQQIIDGNKRYEFRRTIAKNDINTIIIYSSFPVQKIVGKASVKSIISNKPSTLWGLVKQWAGIRRKDFDEYFKGKDIAYAYELGEVAIFKKPKNLSDYGFNTAPQSFMYIRD